MLIHDPFATFGWNISWKKPRRFQQEYFDHLDYFSRKHPKYDARQILRVMKSSKTYYFEDEEIIINRVAKIKRKGIEGRPELPRYLFWEYNLAKLDWNRSYISVIERVLARGTAEELDELVRFYGKDTVLNVFMNQSLSYWPAGMEEHARLYFHLQPEDLLVYHHRAVNRLSFM